MSVRQTVALTIAGTDPSGGAGIQADLRAFQASGIPGASVITAVLAQNTTGVTGIHKLPPSFVARQIDAAAADLIIGAVKIGMLADAQIVSTVAARIRRRNLPNVVLDPVISAKDGTPLLSAKGVQRMIEELFPQCLVVTPNMPEAEILARMQILTAEDAGEAARKIQALGPKYVIIKGGHSSDADHADDLLYDGETFTTLHGPRIAGTPVRGTGCLFSATLAAHLALGRTVEEAARLAKEFTAEAIREAVSVGRGARVWTGAG